jgi:hypothetical protein
MAVGLQLQHDLFQVVHNKEDHLDLLKDLHHNQVIDLHFLQLEVVHLLEEILVEHLPQE